MLFGPATWKQFKRLQRCFEKGGGARVSYLDETIQLMTISLEHESRKSHLSALLESDLIERDITFFFHGSATLESEIKRAGKEPDESYCFHTEKKYPDLAIEIAITSGGIDTLEIYRRFKVSEVWIWQRDALHVFQLQGERYALAGESGHFPKLDLALLEKCARLPEFLTARKQFLAGLKKKRR